MKRTLFGSIMATVVVALTVFAMSGVAAAQSDDPAQVPAGRAIYQANCASCHGAEGMGSNIGRPLTDVAMQGDRARHVLSVTNGRGGMPAFGGALSAQEIDEAVSYVRLTFVSEAELPNTGTSRGTWMLVVAGATSILLGALVLRFERDMGRPSI